MNGRPHKQSMSELKLRRLTEHNQRLKEDLARPRIRVSEASARCVVASCIFSRNVLTVRSLVSLFIVVSPLACLSVAVEMTV